MRVIKIGGNVVNSPKNLAFALDECVLGPQPFVLVHGGGRSATELAQKLGVEQTVVDGRRITSEETLNIVTMVYGGLINKTIVAGLQARGLNAVGFTGADGNLIRAHRRVIAGIDYGFVGDVDRINTAFLLLLLNAGHSVVCAPLSHDGKGSMLNTNADTIAAELAVALAATQEVELVYAFEHKGVLREVHDESSCIPSINRVEYVALQNEGVIVKGMLPKLENAFQARERGVQRVRITRYDALESGTEIL